VKLAAGNYWIGAMSGPTASVAGFRWTSVANARDYNANPFASGPSNPFGAVTSDSEQMSLYATDTPNAPSGPPVNTKAPTISGTAAQGQTLTEAHGQWTGEPSAFAYQWQQCDSAASNCKAIAGATAQSYVPVAGDVGHTLKVQETASNESGPSAPATSAATAAVTPPPPKNTAAPTVTGTAQQGQTLTEHAGSWEGEPTSFELQWLRCDGAGNNCAAIAGATSQTYVPVAADVTHVIRVQELARNTSGPSSPAVSAGTAAVVPLPPSNEGPPTISGSAQVGQTLTEAHGKWSHEPTGFSYQWLQCDGSGNNCASISGATSQTYALGAGDVGHTIKVQETASNAGGSGTPATSSATAVVVPPAPSNKAPPTIAGTVRAGQTLSEAHGEWTSGPTSFAYQWLQCDSSGANCKAIAGATSQTYVLAEGDVGHTLAVQETATNAGGSGGPVTSATTAVVRAASATFGTTTVGASKDTFASERKRVNRYALPEPGSVTKLSVYLEPTSATGQEVLKGLIYSDNGGKPETLLGTSEQLTFKNTNAAGWYDLPFASSVKLAAGNYWIGAMSGPTASVAGFRWTSVANARDYNANPFASGPSNPFGAVTSDSEQMSLYASY
jgi:hypothetical protein